MSSTKKSVKDKDLKNGCFDVLITLDDIIVTFFCYFVLFGAKAPCLPLLWENCCKMCLRDLSEISRGEGGVGILNLGSEMR